jgi:hypothetical protein
MSTRATPGTFACTTCWFVKPDAAKGKRFGKRWQCISCGDTQASNATKKAARRAAPRKKP